MEAVILGLTGRMGAGKDTVFQRLDALYPRVEQISYARKLKLSVAALFNISLADIERMKNQEWQLVNIEDRMVPEVTTSMSFREMLQRYGTEAHRDVFGQDFWLDAALPTTREYASDSIYVVTDVRFDNEVDRVRQLGGYIVKVIGLLDDTPFKHASENVPMDYDYLIDNVVRDDGYVALDEQLRECVEFLEPSQAPGSWAV